MSKSLALYIGPIQMRSRREMIGFYVRLAKPGDVSTAVRVATDVLLHEKLQGVVQVIGEPKTGELPHAEPGFLLLATVPPGTLNPLGATVRFRAEAALTQICRNLGAAVKPQIPYTV